MQSSSEGSDSVIAEFDGRYSFVTPSPAVLREQVEMLRQVHLRAKQLSEQPPEPGESARRWIEMSHASPGLRLIVRHSFRKK
jgi:hypothetical protein